MGQHYRAEELDTDFVKTFCENLNKALKERDVKKSALMTQFNVSRSTFDGWFKGTSIPTLYEAIKLAKLLRVKVSELIPTPLVEYDKNFLDTISNTFLRPEEKLGKPQRVRVRK